MMETQNHFLPKAHKETGMVFSIAPARSAFLLYIILKSLIELSCTLGCGFCTPWWLRKQQCQCIAPEYWLPSVAWLHAQWKDGHLHIVSVLSIQNWAILNFEFWEYSSFYFFLLLSSPISGSNVYIYILCFSNIHSNWAIANFELWGAIFIF